MEIWEALNLGGKTFPTQIATLHKDRPQNQEQFAASTMCDSCLYPQVTWLHPGEVDRYQVDALAMNPPGVAVARNCDPSLSTQAPNLFPAPFGHFQIHF